MRYCLRHTTIYEYGAMVSNSNNMLHLKPRDTMTQKLVSHELNVTPYPDNLRHWVDYFGNATSSFGIEHPHDELSVHVESIVEVQTSQPPMPELSPPLEQACHSYHSRLGAKGLADFQYLFESAFVPINETFSTYARECFPTGSSMLTGAMALMSRIHEEFEYDPTATDLMTPVAEVMEKKAGVCQDFAHLMLSCLRSIGVASRYVSGYLLTVAPPGQEKMVGADASHAWVSVACPGLGWVDLDPTNNCVPDSQHITLAWGRDYADVSPVRGVVLGSGGQKMRVLVDVNPV